jgi:hypothetical protein
MGTLAYNESARTILASLATLDESLGPTELISMWFEDLYFPGQECPIDYASDIWERGQTEWRGCFTTGELAIIECFHSIFSAEVDTLSTDWSTWRSDQGWNRVSEAARAALNDLRSMRSNNSLERTREG